MAAVAAAFQPDDAADRLISLANQRGGPDNVSVVLASVAWLSMWAGQHEGARLPNGRFRQIVWLPRGC
jgi:serine/threonine protein phosphatase PrpC